MNDFLDNLGNDQHQKMLREIANDDMTPKKHDSKQQSELYEKIHNDETEPTYGQISE
jgi:ASC-1-like (ASCH) protein